MTPTEYKALKAQAKAAADAVKRAEIARVEAQRIEGEVRVEELRIRGEVEKWEPLTVAQKRALLLIYQSGGVLREDGYSYKKSYSVPPTYIKIPPVVASGLSSRQCFGEPVKDGAWAKVYRLSEHGEALAKQIEQEGE